VEEIAKQITIITSHGVEIAAAGIIGIAIFKVLFRYLSVFPIPKKMLSKEKIRVEFGSSVAVALELMLGADVLATAVAPSWNDIGQLAAIAIIKLAMVSFIFFSWIDGNLPELGPALVRSVLRRAAGSSPAALAASRWLDIGSRLIRNSFLPSATRHNHSG